MNGAEFNPQLPLGEEELLARYVFFSKRVRSDGTVRPDAFIPHPYPDLSVTRHDDLTEEEIWARGRAAANQRPLYGRADTAAIVYRNEELTVQSDPLPGNRQHMNVQGWPVEKSLQRMIATKIAADSQYQHA